MKVFTSWLGYLVLQIDLGLSLVVILDNLLQVSVRIGHPVDEEGIFTRPLACRLGTSLLLWLVLLAAFLGGSVASQGCVVP